MKGIKLALVFAAVASVMMCGCVSGNAADKVEDEYPSLIADIDSISLGTLTFHSKSFGKLKQHTFSKVFVEPRYNTVVLRYHDGANFQTVVLKQGARVAVIDAVLAFAAEWDEHTLQNVKATAGNAYSKGVMDYSFGIVSPAHSVQNIPFYMNCIFMEGQPYLVLRIPSKPVKGEEALYSPYTELYFSRTQAEALAERINQEYLESLVQEMTLEKYSYE
ncbi:MAG: hypothetical protein J6Y60_13990 [Treponema sp.]|nr:hypothetical protein [Treponema sp.]